MFLSPFRLSLLTGACAAAALAAQPCAADTGYLNWANKTALSPAVQAAPPVAAQVPRGVVAASYAVPPSPYGQVGDPFRKLDWSNKNGPASSPPPAQARTEAATETSPAPPAQEMAPPQRAAVAPPVRPAGRYVASARPPASIEPEDDDLTSAAPPPPAVDKPVAATVLATSPAKAAAPTPAATARPAETEADAGSAYQVPATSPYAARLAAARKAHDDASAPAADAARPAAATASAPAPSEPLAAEETDHVFIPGEHYSSAADAPRYYSVHREYGYRPDPITADTNATGALLDGKIDTEDGDDAAVADDGGDGSDSGGKAKDDSPK